MVSATVDTGVGTAPIVDMGAYEFTHDCPGTGEDLVLLTAVGQGQAPDAGAVRLRGADITTMPANKRPTCMVFQSLALSEI